MRTGHFDEKASGYLVFFVLACAFIIIGTLIIYQRATAYILGEPVIIFGV